MVTRRLLYTLLFVMAGLSVAQAQMSKTARAKKAMEALDYMTAITLYGQILENEDNAEAKINLAECYRRINDPENAEYWYGQVVRLPESEPVHKLRYGQMLQKNGKYDLAKEWFQKYVELVPDDQRGQYALQSCIQAENLLTKNNSVYIVEALSINSNLDDFSPAVAGDQLVFASDRDRGVAMKNEHTWTGHPFLELYTAKFSMRADTTDGCRFRVGAPEKFSKDVNSKYHEAAVSFSNDDKEIFFTRNNFKDGKRGESDEGIVKLKVYHAPNLGEGKWGELESLPFNSDEYSVAHPALTPNGEKLYFTSDMPGGFGGMDLYYSEKENGRWGPPRNLGPAINTEGNEVFPFYHNEGRLYFSSDGHVGLGGLDIFSAVDRGNDDWSTPENPGAPINSSSDDFGIIFNEEGKCGLFSSDRPGGAGGDDIYSFTKTSVPVEIFVFDAKTEEPMPGVEVIISCNGAKLTTGPNGKIMLDMNPEDCCDFAAAFPEYEPNTVDGCAKSKVAGEPARIRIPLQRELEFEIEGIVFDQSTGLPLEGATVTIGSDQCQDLPPSVVTDLSGRYTFKVSKDCCFKVRASKTDYIADTKDSLCTIGATESKKIRENLFLQPTIYTGTDTDVPSTPRGTKFDPATGLYTDVATGQPADGDYNGYIFKGGELISEPTVAQTPASGSETPGTTPTGPGGFQVGRTKVGAGEPLPYMLHVYYDFDQAYVRADAEPELEKLKTMLEENPGLIIEIGSHTDARGTQRYNLRLSQRRAEAVVRWLADRGIDRDRLVPKGYGEDLPINNCTNNIPCSERDHQLNRRTEFRVLGCRDCVSDKEAAKISKPNENVKVNPCVGCPF